MKAISCCCCKCYFRRGCCPEAETEEKKRRESFQDEPTQQRMLRETEEEVGTQEDAGATSAVSLQSGSIPITMMSSSSSFREADCVSEEMLVSTDIVKSVPTDADVGRSMRKHSTVSTTTDGETTTSDDDDGRSLCSSREEASITSQHDNGDLSNEDDTDDTRKTLALFVETILASKEQQLQAANDQDINADEMTRYFEALLADKDQLQRILIARKHEFGPSLDLFWEQVRFRARWKPDQIRREDILTALESGAWRVCGYSKQGHIVTNYKLQYWDPSAYSVDEYVKYVIYMMELLISKMTKGQTTFVMMFDLNGFAPSWVFRRDVRKMILKLIYIAQAQYPERLANVYLWNAPRGFASAWKLIQPMLDEKTASKISFVKKQDGSSSVAERIDSSVLSVEYGGTHPEYPLP